VVLLLLAFCPYHIGQFTVAGLKAQEAVHTSYENADLNSQQTFTVMFKYYDV